jgi:hypothetical protein
LIIGNGNTKRKNGNMKKNNGNMKKREESTIIRLRLSTDK